MIDFFIKVFSNSVVINILSGIVTSVLVAIYVHKKHKKEIRVLNANINKKLLKLVDVYVETWVFTGEKCEKLSQELIQVSKDFQTDMEKHYKFVDTITVLDKLLNYLYSIDSFNYYDYDVTCLIMDLFITDNECMSYERFYEYGDIPISVSNNFANIDNILADYNMVKSELLISLDLLDELSDIFYKRKFLFLCSWDRDVDKYESPAIYSLKNLDKRK